MKIKKLLILFFFPAVLFSCNVAGNQVNTAIIAIPEENEADYESIRQWGGIGSSLFYSTVLAYDEKFSIVNDLAINYKISTDRLTWTVEIRIDARFHDGTELNAEDVVYTFMTARKRENWLDLSMLENAETLDTATVVFTLNKPDMSFIHTLATLGIIKSDSEYEGPDYIPMGSGPYKFIFWNEGKEIVIEENTFYYGKRPDIKRIVFLNTNDDTAFQYAREGRVDIVPVHISQSSHIIEGARIASVGSVEKIGIFFPLTPSHLSVDNRIIGNDITSQSSIRKALDQAINRDYIVAGILGGQGRPSYGSGDGFPWDEPGGRLSAGRTRSAKNILAADGWRDLNSDGILEKKGLIAEFTLFYQEDDIIAQSIAAAISNTALEAGIKIHPAGKNEKELKELIFRNPVLFSWGSQDLFEMYRLFHSSNTDSAAHPSYYKNTTVDNYLDLAKKSNTHNAAVQRLRQVQWDGETGISMKGDSPIVWLVSPSHTYFVNDRIKIENTKLEKRGFGWPVLESIRYWSWKEEK